MSRSPELYQWRTEIAKHFPHLARRKDSFVNE